MKTLLDLFCGAGGAAMGYHRAGFKVVGVDHKPQPRFPFEFHRADALEFLEAHGHEYDVIHASPPCQRYSVITPADRKEFHADLIEPTRGKIREIEKPYIIENVPGARKYLKSPIMLCGSMFGLKVYRHRFFEIKPMVSKLMPPCFHRERLPRSGHGMSENGYMSITGHFSNVKEARLAMGIDWMTRDELSQAIPPAYTEWIGKRIMELLP